MRARHAPRAVRALHDALDWLFADAWHVFLVVLVSEVLGSWVLGSGGLTMVLFLAGLAVSYAIVRVFDPERAVELLVRISPQQLTVHRGEVCIGQVPLTTVGRVHVDGGLTPRLVVRRASGAPLEIDMSWEPKDHAVWLASHIEQAARGVRERQGTRADIPEALDPLR